MPIRSPKHPNLRIFEHPVIQDKLTRIRNKETRPVEFRRLLNEIAGLMIFQMSRGFKTVETPVQTPIEHTTGPRLSSPITLVPILRAGL